MNKIENIQTINKEDLDNILKVWYSSVKATHLFLKEDEIMRIKPQVIQGINYVENLLSFRDKKGKIIAFMGVHDKKIEMLFVEASLIRKGIWKRFVDYATNKLNVKYVDVNEDNNDLLNFIKKWALPFLIV